MPVNVEKCKVMHLGYHNKRVGYELGRVKLGTTEEERDLGVMLSDRFKVGGQRLKAAKKGNQILGMIKRTEPSPVEKRISLFPCTSLW